MSLVFQNIDPPPPLRPASVYPPPLLAGGGGRTHSPGGEGVGGLIFWKTRDIVLHSYSNNLSTGDTQENVEREALADGGGGKGAGVEPNDTTAKKPDPL